MMKRHVVFYITLTLVLLNTISCASPKNPPMEDPPEVTGNCPKVEKVEPVCSAEGFNVYSDVKPPYYGASPNKTVVLTNNETARNPSWSELREFLKIDTADDNYYLPGIWVCAEFATELHNKSEAAGIRAAWVTLEFTDNSQGHALNAFETRDKGLVFIDSTGSTPVVEIPAISAETEVLVEETYYFDSNYKKAYVEIGKEYGIIGFDVKSSFDYNSYQNYVDKWERLRERIEDFRNTSDLYLIGQVRYFLLDKEYRKLLGGRTEIADDFEYHKLLNMSDDLERMQGDLEEDKTALDTEAYFISLDLEELGYRRRKSLGIVRTVEIYW